MKNLLWVTIVLVSSLLLSSMLVSCSNDEEYNFHSLQGQSVMLNYCCFSWKGNADGTISYDITSTVNEKSEKKGIRLLLDDQEIIILKESELPYHGTIPVQKTGDHKFTFEVGIIPEINIGGVGVIENIGISASTSLTIPFTVTFD